MSTIDPSTAAGLVDREVRTGDRDGTATRIVVARRTYDTDRPDLWAALTEPERIPRWFSPVTGDLEVGGRYQVEGNAGGVVERCDAPESFVVTWEMGPMLSWLHVTLTPVDDGTVLELAHEAPVDPDMWGQFGPGAVGLGWDLALLGLAAHLDTGESVDPDTAMSFPTSPTGRAFVERAGADWATAAVADGDARDDADRAAAASIDFYTIVPEDGDAGDTSGSEPAS